VDVDHTEIISTAASGINVWNPAFDVTPAELIDGVVTEVESWKSGRTYIPL
jgi:methylthioribose-1-phosphate isomerase